MFDRQVDNPKVELKVDVININGDAEILNKCKSLRDYMTFVEKVRNKTDVKMDVKEVVTEAIDECIEENILVDFFQEHREEIVEVSIYDYEEDKVRKTLADEAREEVRCLNLMKLLKIDMIKKFIMKYDYDAAFELAQELQADISSDAYTLLNIANNRLKLNTSEISKLMRDRQYDIYPVKDSNKLKLFEYACAIQIKLEKKEYSDFIRGITPLIVDVLEQILKLKLNIDINKSCNIKKDGNKIWNTGKLQANGLYNILDKAYEEKGGFREEPVYSHALAHIIKAKSQDDILKQKVEDIVHVEQSVRNLAAHQIVSVTAEWFVVKSGKSADDIMNIIKYLLVQSEVDQLLKDTSLTEQADNIRKWYDGYHFGGFDVYCPWDVMNYILELQRNPNAKPVSYWKNTSDNAIIRSFIDYAGSTITNKLETLMDGGCIVQRMDDNLTYDYLHSSEDNLWSTLYLTGYLTCAREDDYKGELPDGMAALLIPNAEIKEIFETTVIKWFDDSTKKWNRNALFDAVWNGDSEGITKEMNKLLRRTISYHDYREDFYHAFLAGIFTGAGYMVDSNKEHGEGRSDVVVYDSINARVAIFEAKYTKVLGNLESECDRALQQIDDKMYAKEYEDDYDQILCYGISFFKKRCIVKKK